MPRRFRAGRTIDFKQWDGLPGLKTGFSADGIGLGGSLAFTEPATIMRMICGGGLVAMDETRQVGDRADFTYAIGIISSDAFAAGTTAVPDPTSEPEYPWLYWTSWSMNAFAADGDSALGSSVFRLPPWQSQAMRKLKPGQSLFMVIEGTGFQGAPVVDVDLEQVRVLIGT